MASPLVAHKYLRSETSKRGRFSNYDPGGAHPVMSTVRSDIWGKSMPTVTRYMMFKGQPMTPVLPPSTFDCATVDHLKANEWAEAYWAFTHIDNARAAVQAVSRESGQDHSDEDTIVVPQAAQAIVHRVEIADDGSVSVFLADHGWHPDTALLGTLTMDEVYRRADVEPPWSAQNFEAQMHRRGFVAAVVAFDPKGEASPAHTDLARISAAMAARFAEVNGFQRKVEGSLFEDIQDFDPTPFTNHPLIHATRSLWQQGYGGAIFRTDRLGPGVSHASAVAAMRRAGEDEAARCRDECR